MIPPPEQTQVWIDFDGTITRIDVLDELIRRFAVDDSWMQAEEDWQIGRIGSRQCLTRQFAVVRAADDQLSDLLDGIPVDPGFKPLVDLLDRHSVPWFILSDGVDRFIRAITARAGVTPRFRANAIDTTGPQMRLLCPHESPACRSDSAHCKCASMAELSAGRKDVYIGDGRSDLCPSRVVVHRFAKNVLARNLDREGLAYDRYESLVDVARTIEAAWSHGISV